MAEHSKSMSPLTGLGILLAVIVVIGAFLGLLGLVGVHDGWAAFLFLLSWTMIEKGSMENFPRALIGALVGATAAALFVALPLWLGESTGGLAFLGIALVLTYMLIMGWLPIAVNVTTMIYLTVGTIPYVAKGMDIPGIFTAIGLAAVYFGAIGLIAAQIAKRRATGSVAETQPVSI
jgi:uncharacterized membrane-anchored protein YitT (DUF2179 family)